MKKLLSLLIVLVLTVSLSSVFAEAQPMGSDLIERNNYDYDRLEVGVLTPMSGKFFTSLWGANASDIDIRTLIHGYDTVEWKGSEGSFVLDSSVVTGIVVTANAAGDRTYTIALAEDLCWNDGTPITAADYVFSWLLEMSNEITSLGASATMGAYLKGAEEYRSGASEVLSGVRLLGEHQFSLTVKAENLPFFYEMAYVSCKPVPVSVIAPGCIVKDDGAGAYIANEDPEIEEPLFTAELLRETILDEETGYLTHPALTCGAYELVSYDGETAELEMNEYFKGTSAGRKPQLNTLTVKNVSNADAIGLLSAADLGLVDKVTNASTVADGISLVAEGYHSMATYARSGLSFISFCCERDTVASVPVRQAIAMCLDREAMINDYVGAYGLAVNGYYGVGQWMFQVVNGTLVPQIDAPAEDADEETRAAYDAQVEGYAALSMDGLKAYDPDPDAARKLLEADGWTLNAAGEAFDPEQDAYRCRLNEDGTLTALELKLLVPAGNAMEPLLSGSFAENLSSIGILLTVEEKPYAELLSIYYRQTERDCDMIYLATNFDAVFDPAETFDPADAWQGVNNRTGIRDQELYRLALDMRMTEPGDVLSYCQKWVAFQERWTEVLPAIPVYSNVYFDFYTSNLCDFPVTGEFTWAQAVIGAYMSDIDFNAEEEPGEGELIIE